MTEYLVRFLIGGVAVSAFALLGDLLRPTSFAGLFGAAPSVALASLGLAVINHGAPNAATQALAMHPQRHASGIRVPGVQVVERGDVAHYARVQCP